ncbi:MAG: SusC/RagA family TonB-linked outer membrane protein, partial [Rudanella sp.]|nr:SusC/RagA family TonB-linked outer membrane protein [Rudanella sp.]
MTAPSRSYLGPLLIIDALFFVFGFVIWVNSVLIAFFKQAFNLSTVGSNLVAFAFFISYTAMAVSSSAVLKRTGFKNGMLLGLGIMAIGTLVFVPAAEALSYPQFLVGLFLIGIGLTVLQTPSNPYVTILGPRESAAQRISFMGVANKPAGIASQFKQHSRAIKKWVIQAYMRFIAFFIPTKPAKFAIKTNLIFHQSLLPMTFSLRKLLMMLILLGAFAVRANAQVERDPGGFITGKVTSAEDGTPIPGASIVVKGTSRGTNSDASGNFRIQANTGQQLRISFIGTQTKDVTVGNATTVTIQLAQETGTLNEVVVTALNINVEKRQLGYAVTEVKGDDLANSQRDNFVNALQGRVAGLQVGTSSGMPGASSGIIIRGVNSISGNNQPLYVVDGMPIDNRTAQNNQFVAGGITGQSTENRNIDFSNRAQDINPNDIEKITILKGPEAAALYGVDAANGAILITTKKGKAGQGKITYTGTYTLQKVGALPEVQRVYGQGNNGVTQNTSFNAFGPRYAENTPLFDNGAGFLRDGTGQRHNISFDGGSDRYTYRLSAGYFNSQGVIPTTNYKRLNISLGGTAKITNKLSIESTLQYINTDNIKVSKGTNSFLLGLVSWPANDDMSAYLNPDGSRRRVTTASSEIENPYFDVFKNKLQDKGNRSITNISLNYAFTDWLNLTGRVGLDVYSTQYLFMYHPESNRSGGIIGGALDQATDNNRTLTSQYVLSAKKKFGKLNLSGLVGQALYDFNYTSLATRGEKFLDPNFISINNTD